jgi:Uncharacterized conserved protein
MDIQFEKDLFAPIRDFFIDKGFEVRSEVNHCDICAIKDDQLIIIELKKNLSVDLLVQAVDRQKIADLVYVAIPKPKKRTSFAKWRDICHLLRRLELGLILVSTKNKKAYVEVAVQPEPFDRLKSIQANKRHRSKLIKEFNGRSLDLNTGGSTGKKLVTAYREASLYIACCINMFGPSSAANLKKYGADNKKAYSILYANHYGWFCKVGKGVYDLTDIGRDSLNLYSAMIDILKVNIEAAASKTTEDV